MTKARNNKLGFTLVELVVVIAIIAIFSTVLLVGITTLITVSEERSGKVRQQSQKYDAASQDVSLSLKSDYSDIKTWKSDDPYWLDDEEEDSSGSSTIVNSDGGSYFDTNEDDGEDVTTEESEEVTDPEVVEDPVTVEDPKEEVTTSSSYQASTDLSTNSNLSGSVNLGDASSVSSSANYHDTWGRDVYKIDLNGSGNIYSITIQVSGSNVKYNQNWNWKYGNSAVEDLGDGMYRINYNANNKYCAPDSSMTVIFESDSSVSVKVESVSYYNN